MSIDPDSIPHHSPDVPSRTVDGKGILVDLQSGDYFSLNATGRFVWEQIDGLRDVRSIASLLAAEFSIDADTALTDCAELIQSLSDAGLVKLTGTG